MTSQEISFIDIFETFGYSILIPAIQRDYAQGRITATATKIRKNFVEELKDYLLDGTSHSLDFIYGYGTDKFFIPLDGQQRLTTLWLLLMYLFQGWLSAIQQIKPREFVYKQLSSLLLYSIFYPIR